MPPSNQAHPLSAPLAHAPSTEPTAGVRTYLLHQRVTVHLAWRQSLALLVQDRLGDLLQLATQHPAREDKGEVAPAKDSGRWASSCAMKLCVEGAGSNTAEPISGGL